MVDRQKIETNIAHIFLCSLALTDFNNHLIITLVDEKNWTVLLEQRCWKISHAVYWLHNAIAYQMSLRYRYRGENEGLAALFSTIVSLNTKKRKIMLKESGFIYTKTNQVSKHLFKKRKQSKELEGEALSRLWTFAHHIVILFLKLLSFINKCIF